MHCKERWGWSEEVVESKWKDALQDPQVLKGTDDEGWTTVAKYSSTSVDSKRTLTHEREVAQTSQTDASQHELRSLAQDLMETGDLHAHTGIFDVTSLPALPGFGRFGSGGPAAKAPCPSFMCCCTAHALPCEL